MRSIKMADEVVLEARIWTNPFVVAVRIGTGVAVGTSVGVGVGSKVGVGVAVGVGVGVAGRKAVLLVRRPCGPRATVASVNPAAISASISTPPTTVTFAMAIPYCV